MREAQFLCERNLLYAIITCAVLSEHPEYCVFSLLCVYLIIFYTGRRLARVIYPNDEDATALRSLQYCFEKFQPATVHRGFAAIKMYYNSIL